MGPWGVSVWPEFTWIGGRLAGFGSTLGLFWCNSELNIKCGEHFHHSADSWVVLAG